MKYVKTFEDYMSGFETSDAYKKRQIEKLKKERKQKINKICSNHEI
jgi:hypothetical protein